MTTPFNSHANSRVQQIVMRRVRTLHALQLFLTPTAVSVAALVLALWGIGREVWVAHVLHNMPSLQNAPALFNFSLSAVEHTRSIVQVLLLVIGAAVLWLGFAIVRSLQIYTFTEPAQFA